MKRIAWELSGGMSETRKVTHSRFVLTNQMTAFAQTFIVLISDALGLSSKHTHMHAHTHCSLLQHFLRPVLRIPRNVLSQQNAAFILVLIHTEAKGDRQWT